jgi:hypothetical protein
MTKKSSNRTVTGCATEKHTNYAKFTFAELNGFPEALENSSAVAALARDIRENGLRQPILVDEHRRIWCGRLRFLACKKLKRSFLVKRIKATDGEAAARSELVGRDMTIYDEVRIVGAVIDMLKAKYGKKCGREIIAKHMKTVYGWQRRVSPKQMDFYKKLHEAVNADATDETKDILRKAASVNEARELLGQTKKGQKPRKGKTAQARKSKVTAQQLQSRLLNMLGWLREHRNLASAKKMYNELKKFVAEMSGKPSKANRK